MSSRMEKYHSNHVDSGYNRSKKNEAIYKQIQDSEQYSNIEEVITIDTNNEIEIEKVKDLITSRENYKKEKVYKSLLAKKEEVPVREPVEQEEEKNYDLKELLSQAKASKKDDKDRYRKLKKINYNIREKLSPKVTNPDTDEEELKQLINTISRNKELNDLANKADVGLFDELKSDTMVGTPETVKNIIEETKSQTHLEENENTTSSFDNSFFTSSMNFDTKDFEELEEHKSSTPLKVIMIIISVLLIIIFGIVIYKYFWI